MHIHDACSVEISDQQRKRFMGDDGVTHGDITDVDGAYTASLFYMPRRQACTSRLYICASHTTFTIICGDYPYDGDDIMVTMCVLDSVTYMC
jgi:hypothetical protein